MKAPAKTEKQVLISSLTSKCQTTIPAKIRTILKLGPGDKVKFEIKDGKVMISKIEPEDKVWLLAIESTLASEWSKDDDDDL